MKKGIFILVAIATFIGIDLSFVVRLFYIPSFPYTNKPIEIRFVGNSNDTLILPVLHYDINIEDREFRDLIEFFHASEAYNFIRNNLNVFDFFDSSTYNCSVYFDTVLNDSTVYSLDIIKAISIYENQEQNLEHHLYVKSDFGFVEIEEVKGHVSALYCDMRWRCYEEYIFPNNMYGKSKLSFISDISFWEF